MGIPLKITFDGREIRIVGNKDGLQYLADCCISIIGQAGPGAHWHLLPQMNNLLEGSIATAIEYSETPE